LPLDDSPVSSTGAAARVSGADRDRVSATCRVLHTMGQRSTSHLDRATCGATLFAQRTRARNRAELTEIGNVCREMKIVTRGTIYSVALPAVAPRTGDGGIWFRFCGNVHTSFGLVPFYI
jgi:hypothetical protein